MSLFFESIRLVNGRPMNLYEHQQRINQCIRSTRKTPTLDIKKHIQSLDLPESGVYKLRIQYNASIQEITQTTCTIYHEKEIHQLALIHDHQIDYPYKSENRQMLDRAFAQRGEADDIIIVRDGLLTDTWYCNIALFDGQSWWTPQFPLLKGTMRAKLLKRQIIQERNIPFDSLEEYRKIRLFNAMIPWSRKKDIRI